METVGRQYAYIKFDRVIQKKRREYADPNSNANSKKINDDLQCIHNIMRKTIDDVLDRGNKLDGMVIVYRYSVFIVYYYINLYSLNISYSLCVFLIYRCV